MRRRRLLGQSKRQSTEDLRRTLAKYAEQVEAHHQAAEIGKKVKSEAAYNHQSELKA